MFGQGKTFRAQSAMEYLMTYGWAILIIAVVLGALFSLGVFSGSSLLGTACTASPGFLCQNPALQQNGTLGFEFGINQGTSTFYNIMMACAATANTGGYPNNAQAFEVVNSLGIAGGNVPYPSNSIVLSSGQTVQVSNLICYGATGTAVGTNSMLAPIGTAFSGFLWLNYTTGSQSPGTGNIWYTQKVATVTVKVV